MARSERDDGSYWSKYRDTERDVGLYQKDRSALPFHDRLFLKERRVDLKNKTPRDLKIWQADSRFQREGSGAVFLLTGWPDRELNVHSARFVHSSCLGNAPGGPLVTLWPGSTRNHSLTLYSPQRSHR